MDSYKLAICAYLNKISKGNFNLEEFRRIKGNINSMREHAELLSSVRDDINEYKASGSMSPRVQLLRERAAIHGSIAHGATRSGSWKRQIKICECNKKF
ncbi:hypothetical protein OIU76_007653 [Salix suchowensis]|nr:hypothetical protein OIU76_007653 [Salix suchowensis]